MKKMNAMMLMATVILAGGALFAQNRVGIGLGWGLAYERFDDQRMIGIGQLIDINLQMDEGLILTVQVEQQNISYDDGVDTTEGDANYFGFGLKYKVSMASAGLVIGKSDINLPDPTGGVSDEEQTNKFIELCLAVNMLEKQGAKIDYFVSISLNYRMIIVEDMDFGGAVADPIQTLSGLKAAFQIGVNF